MFGSKHFWAYYGKKKRTVAKEIISPFNPRQARRFNFDHIKPDDDTWREKVVMIDNETSTAEMRSYFKSKITGHCVWDEPPTGATRIIYIDEQ